MTGPKYTELLVRLPKLTSTWTMPVLDSVVLPSSGPSYVAFDVNRRLLV